MKKRLLSVLLAAVMLLTVLTMTGVSAADTLPFEDVKSDDWFYPYVVDVYEAGLIKGKSDTEFAPSATMTRAELVTLLSRLAGEDVTGNYTHAAKFSDVSESSWYGSYVGWAAKNGIVNGYNDGTFGPDNPIKREELAALIVRMLAYMGVTLPDAPSVDSFADSDKISDWAYDSVEEVRLKGIVAGDNMGRFNPTNSVTRAEASTMFSRLWEKLDRDPMYASLDNIYVLTDSEDGEVKLYFGDADTVTLENLNMLLLQAQLNMNTVEYRLSASEEELSAIRSGAYASLSNGGSVSATLNISIKNLLTGDETETKEIKVKLIKDGEFDKNSIPEFKFKLKTDGTAEIVDYVGVKNVRNLVIPSELGGYKVTSIGERAFAESRELLSVTIPEGVTQIRPRAFALCTSLKNVNIADSVEKVGRAAFYYCSELRSVKLSNGMKSIPDYMFYMCTSLDKIEFPESVTEIGMASFGLCPLKNITFSSKLERINEYSFEGAAITKVTIPDSCERVGSWAFYDCKNLSEVTVGSGVSWLGSGIFYNTDVEEIDYNGTKAMFDKVTTRATFEDYMTVNYKAD